MSDVVKVTLTAAKMVGGLHYTAGDAVSMATKDARYFIGRGWATEFVEPERKKPGPKPKPSAE